MPGAHLPMLREPWSASDAWPDRARIVNELLERPATASALADPLRPVWASLLAGRQLGQGVLSATLGLPPLLFLRMWRDYFPGPVLSLCGGAGEDIVEFDDLLHLLQVSEGQDGRRGRLLRALDKDAPVFGDG